MASGGGDEGQLAVPIPPEGEDEHDLIQPIEDSFPDDDSAYGGSDASSITTSLASSAWNYVYENGRRYQQIGDQKYIFPNDEQEQDRLDMLHHIYMLVQGGRLHTVPTVNPHRVLDIGTGTGIWALDFANEFPEAEVIGIDISPIQSLMTVPNCQFIVDDLELDWNYPESRKFDYIHQRSMSGSIGDWTRLYRQALTHLRPGGWLEIQEFEIHFYSQLRDGLPAESPVTRWQNLIDEGSVRLGRRLNYASSFEKHLKDAGFVDVRVQIIKTPIGAWPKDRALREIGIFLQAQMNTALEAVTLAYFTRALGWSELETKVMLSDVRGEFNKKANLLYTFCWFITARKPE